MNFILLAGGSGTRLYPLSTPEYPKQFLKMFNGQSTFKMAMKSFYMSRIAEEPIYITCAEQHADIVENQIMNRSNVHILRESVPVGTYNAIKGALNYVVDEDEWCIVMSADHVIDDSNQLSKITIDLEHKNKAFYVLGVPAEYASTEYGYILAEGDEVIHFIEKPDNQLAYQLQHAGALWNSGCFIFTKRIFNEMQTNSDYKTIDEVLLQGGANKFKVIKTSKFWKDIGTFDRLIATLKEL